jgi:hypothetical protein
MEIGIPFSSNAILDSEQSIGQTFSSPYSGLRGIYIFINPVHLDEGSLICSIYENQDRSNPVARSISSVEDLKQSGFYRFDFEPLRDSAGKSYFFEFEIDNAGTLGVGIGSAASYENGSLYINRTPADAQIAFKAEYQWSFLMLGEAKKIAGLILMMGWALLIFTLPGWALLSLFNFQWKNQDWITHLVLSWGLSISFYPLLMLWTSWINLDLGKYYLWLPLIPAAIFLTWKNRHMIKTVVMKPQTVLKKPFPGKRQNTVHTITFLAVCLIILATRIWHIKNLEIPLWGDSYHHTTLVQLMIDNSGLFNSWLPYAPYQSFTSHFGFHSNAAVFHWATSQDIPISVLIIGQFFNTMAAISLYPLAVELSNQRKWAGILTVALAGLGSIMPAFYINWGRYAQLSGQVLFPIVIFLLLRPAPKRKGLIYVIVMSTLFAGTSVSYYRMPLFLLAFFPSFLFRWFRKIKSKEVEFSDLLKKWGGFIILSIILLLPLVIRLRQGRLTSTIIPDNQAYGFAFQDLFNDIKIWQHINEFYPVWLLILGAIGWFVSGIRKNWETVLLPLGLVILQLYYLGQLSTLPFAYFTDPFSILLFFYIPLTLLSSQIITLIKFDLNRKLGWAVAVICLLFTIGFAWERRTITDSHTHALVTDPDLRAYEWIKTNIPDDSLFLIEGAQGRTIVGSDGGWWLPILAERQNTIPPQYAFNEVPISSNYNNWVNEIYQTLLKINIGSKEGFNYLCDWGISHIYIGQKQGSVGDSGTQPLFTIEQLRNETYFELLYQEDMVRIYKINSLNCNAE